MPEVIANTTPLIALANIGRLDILEKIYGNILIPRAVMNEIISEPAKRRVNDSKWIRVEDIEDTSQKKMYKAKLHEGEVEVMILAQEKNADLVIIDDNAAKKTAKYLGLKVTGTLGVLLRAKREGILDRITPVIDELIKDGLYISDDILQYVLKQADEL